MSFSFRQQNGVQKQVRDIAGNQIENALRDCENGEADLGKTIHSLRRRCKRLRGLVRLIEPGFADFKAENSAFRDAATALAGARDAQVMIETFDGLNLGSQIGTETVEPLRAQLVKSTEGIAGDSPSPLGPFQDMFEAAAKRVRRWKIEGKGFAAIEDGLIQTYRQLHATMALARDTGSDEALHEWRKYVKYHWHHVSLLLPSAPDVLKPHKALLDQLGELLGDHHNLSVLNQHLTSLDQGQMVAPIIEERQHRLDQHAFKLGMQVAAEKPRELGNRFAHYWSLLPKEA